MCVKMEGKTSKQIKMLTFEKAGNGRVVGAAKEKTLFYILTLEPCKCFI